MGWTIYWAASQPRAPPRRPVIVGGDHFSPSPLDVAGFFSASRRAQVLGDSIALGSVRRETNCFHYSVVQQLQFVCTYYNPIHHVPPYRFSSTVWVDASSSTTVQHQANVLFAVR